jgi:lipid A 3-O-deacylase
MRWTHLLVAASSLTAATGVRGADPPSSDDETPPTTEESENRGWGTPVRISLFWENDGTGAKIIDRTDRHYSNGLLFDMAWQPDWADDLAPHMPFADAFGANPRTAFGFTIGHQIHTPEDISTSEPIPDDWPYSGYVYASIYWQRESVRPNSIPTADHFELDFGVVGPWAGGRNIQQGVHRAFSEPDINGWSNQLSNEPAINLTVRKKWRLTTGAYDNGVEVQCIPSTGFILGTVHRRLEGDVTVRFGMNLPDDYGPPRLADVGIATGDGWSEGFGWYVFARGGARVVQYNMLLDGNQWKDSLGVESLPLIGEAQIGAVVRLFDLIDIGYSQTFKTHEFESQSGSDAYGAWTISFSRTF